MICFKALFEWPKAEAEGLHRGKRFDALEKKRTNLNGIVVKNSWNAQPPFVKFGKVPSGFYVDVLTELQAQLNFTLEHVKSPGRGWGIKRKNGSWTGLVGMIVNKKIDMSANIGLTQQRQGDINFLWPTFQKEMTLIAKGGTRRASQ